VQALHFGFEGSGGDGFALQGDGGAQVLFDVADIGGISSVGAGVGKQNGREDDGFAASGRYGHARSR